MKQVQHKTARRIAESHGIVTNKDFKAQGIHPETVRRMVMQGKLQKVDRGLYMIRQDTSQRYVSFAQIATKNPDAVICLLSALAYHGIGTQNPHKVWIALPRGTRIPSMKHLALEVVTYSHDKWKTGVEVHRLTNVDVQITNIPKTVVDCFKYRNKIGIDVAVEALRDVIENGRCKISEFTLYAKIARVQRVMRPYIEALIE